MKNRRGKKKEKIFTGKKETFFRASNFLFDFFFSPCTSSEASDLGSMGDDDEGRKTWHGVVSYKV